MLYCGFNAGNYICHNSDNREDETVEITFYSFHPSQAIYI